MCGGWGTCDFVREDGLEHLALFLLVFYTHCAVVLRWAAVLCCRSSHVRRALVHGAHGGETSGRRTHLDYNNS